MKKLVSLPPNLVECLHDIEKADRTEWFCTSDPIGSKLDVYKRQSLYWAQRKFLVGKF